jgi:hypothetical protein
MPAHIMSVRLSATWVVDCTHTYQHIPVHSALADLMAWLVLESGGVPCISPQHTPGTGLPKYKVCKWQVASVNKNWHAVPKLLTGAI